MLAGISKAGPTIYIIAAVLIIVAFFGGRRILRKIGRKLPTSTFTWKDYLRGQGTLLIGFLLIGGVVAAVASYFGPWEGKIFRDGHLIEYRQLNPSEHAIYEEQDVEGYRHITVLARTMAPQNGAATVVIYGDSKSGRKQEINRLESVADSWSRWDQDTSGKHITLKITNGGAGQGATRVDVLVYLFPE